MIFRSKAEEKTWDTWVFYHQGVFYLYYLISAAHPGDGFGVATSTDGVAWEDHGRVLSPSPQMVRYMGGGTVWEHAGGDPPGRFLTNYSEWRRVGEKNVQGLYFACSNDLLHWEKLAEETDFPIDERYYKRIDPNAQFFWQDPRWDGISAIPRPGGGYYGFWTAIPVDRFSFGYGESADGLHWQALEPPVIDWPGEPCMRFIEVGGVWQLGDRFYAMLADYASDHCGMFTFIADAPGGPYRLSPRNFELLRNRGRMHVYFSRFFQGPDGPLVNHHALAEGAFSDPHFVVYTSPFKRAVVEAGTLYLKWWQGNEKIKGVEVGLPTAGTDIGYPGERGVVLEGRLLFPASIAIATAGGGKTILSVDRQGVVEIGQQDPQAEIRWEERADRQRSFGDGASFRLLLHKTMLELYLDDYLMQCYTLEQTPTGSIAVDNASGLRLWLWREGIG